MPRRKSAEAIREQTNRICRMAVSRLHEGTIMGETFNRRIEAVSSIERNYLRNIHKNPLYILEVRKHNSNADKLTFLRNEYMYSDSISCT